MPFAVLASILVSVIVFAFKNVPLGIPRDAVVHLWLLLAIVLAAGFILLLFAAYSKLQIRADNHKRRAQKAMSPTARAAAEARDPCMKAADRGWWNWVHLFAHEIGIALFVAGMVTVLFELTLHVGEEEERAKEQKLMEENVFQAVFGQSIDRSIIKEVVDGVLQQPLLREDLNVDFHFCCVDKSKKYLQLHVTVTYRIRNLTQKTIYLPEAPQEVVDAEAKNAQARALSPTRNDIRHFFQNIDAGGVQTDAFLAFKVTDDNLKKKLNLTDKMLSDALAEAKKRVTPNAGSPPQGAPNIESSHGVRVVTAGGEEDGFTGAAGNDEFTYLFGPRRQQINIKKKMEIEPAHALLISYSYQVTRRHSDLMVFHTTQPTTSFQFTVSKGDGVPDLRFDVDSTHRRRLIQVSPGEQKVGVGETYKFQIPAGVLPGQGIELYWYPWPETELTRLGAILPLAF
jgi:hypothetical protein